MPLVWNRVLLTCISLLFVPGVIKYARKTSKRGILELAGIGCLVCLHWVAFYGSIKYSNVSVALSCLATTSFMTSLLEPLILRRRWKSYEVALGLLVVPGVYLIFYFSKFYLTGIILGLLAAFLAATFTILNKTVIEKHDARSMTFIELFSGFVFLSLLMPFYLRFFPEYTLIPALPDFGYLLILALACTTLPFVLGLYALRHLSAFASTLTVNLEPLYGIILAILFFKENQDMDNRFYLGSLIILLAVFIHPWLKKRFDKELPIHQ